MKFIAWLFYWFVRLLAWLESDSKRKRHTWHINDSGNMSDLERGDQTYNIKEK